jgi:peptidoglycan/LPS O-acetylase OafA/YrhL
VYRLLRYRRSGRDRQAGIVCSRKVRFLRHGKNIGMTTTAPAPASVVHSQRFLLLDLMRGIAALAVLVYHASIYLGVQLLPTAYLAVDMFFLLSGFVIAHNYDRKISAGMSFREFMTQRLIRLYPCFLLTLIIGFILAAARLTRDTGYFDGWRLLGAGILNGLFLPSYVMPNHINNIFPFNGSAWSLTFELVANIVYWVLFPYLTASRLLLLICVAAVVEAIAASLAGTIDVGMRPMDFWLGIPRVLLPFFLGTALRRHVWDRFTFELSSAGVCGVVLLLLLGFSLSRLFDASTLPVAEFIAISVLFPALLLAVSRTSPGPRLAVVCKLTGDASYPVYLLQVPFVGLFAALPQVLFHMKAKDFIPLVGIAHISCTLLCGLWVDRHFELPVRTWLKSRLRMTSKVELSVETKSA